MKGILLVIGILSLPSLACAQPFRGHERMLRIPRCPIGYQRIGHVCRPALPIFPRRGHDHQHLSPFGRY